MPRRHGKSEATANTKRYATTRRDDGRQLEEVLQRERLRAGTRMLRSPIFVQCSWMVLQDGQCGGLRWELCGETVLELRLRNGAMSCASMRSAHPKQ